MALDLAGMLTGVSKQPIDPRLNMQQQQLALGANATKMMQGGMESMRRSAGGEAPVAQQLQMAMSKLDLQNPDDLRKLISIQMATGDRTGAAKTAAMLQAVEAKQKLPAQAASVADGLPPAYSELADAIRNNVSGAMEQGLKILGNIPAAKKEGSNIEEWRVAVDENDYQGTLQDWVALKKVKGTTVNTGKTPEAIEAELGKDMTLARFKSMSDDLIKRGSLTKESYDKFMPIYEQLESLEESGAIEEGGAGSTFFADATNYLTSALQTLDPDFVVPAGTSAKLQYESMSKLLKAKMTEMTKGAISDRENAEHNKYTLSVNMPSAVRKGKLNMDKAILMSANNRVNAEELWFDKYKTSSGFRAAWSRYANDFPRTSGATIRNVTDENGNVSKKLVDNFEMIEDNMQLFDRLYLNKQTSGSPVFTNGEEKISLKQVKEKLRDTKIRALMDAADVKKPTKIMEEDAERFVRKNIGTALLQKLELEGWRVSK